jgi:hypothetical protein
MEAQIKNHPFGNKKDRRIHDEIQKNIFWDGRRHIFDWVQTALCTPGYSVQSGLAGSRRLYKYRAGLDHHNLEPYAKSG